MNKPEEQDDAAAALRVLARHWPGANSTAASVDSTPSVCCLLFPDSLSRSGPVADMWAFVKKTFPCFCYRESVPRAVCFVPRFVAEVLAFDSEAVSDVDVPFDVAAAMWNRPYDDDGYHLSADWDALAEIAEDLQLADADVAQTAATLMGDSCTMSPADLALAVRAILR